MRRDSDEHCVNVPLRTTDEFADLWHQDIHGSDGLLIVVELHVEGLDSLRIVDDNRWLGVDLLADVTFMLRAEIITPLRILLEFDFAISEVCLQSGVRSQDGRA